MGITLGGTNNLEEKTSPVTSEQTETLAPDTSIEPKKIRNEAGRL